MDVFNRPPSLLLAVRRTKPLRLRICEQNLPVLRRAEHVYSESFSSRRSESTAMRRPAGTRVVLSFVRLARFPVDVFMREPQRFDIHSLEHG